MPADSAHRTRTPEADGIAERQHLPTHALHVKRIPTPIWLKARQNALQSGMHFRDYIIQLLADSTPYPHPPQSSRTRPESDDRIDPAEPSPNNHST
jgi:hypothetical protein